MPGVERLSVDQAVRDAERAAKLNIPCIALFPYTDPGLRDEQGKALPPSFSRYTAVLVKDGESWKVAAFRSLPQLKSKLTPADMH